VFQAGFIVDYSSLNKGIVTTNLKCIIGIQGPGSLQPERCAQARDSYETNGGQAYNFKQHDNEKKETAKLSEERFGVRRQTFP
jgi:hypothetical protein